MPAVPSGTRFVAFDAKTTFVPSGAQVERLSAGANRTQLQLESLGAAEAAAIQASVVVTLAADASWSRRLCGATLVDSKGKVAEAWYKVSPKGTVDNLLASLKD